MLDDVRVDRTRSPLSIESELALLRQRDALLEQCESRGLQVQEFMKQTSNESAAASRDMSARVMPFPAKASEAL